MLELVEEALDQIALAVSLAVNDAAEADIALRGNVGRRAAASMSSMMVRAKNPRFDAPGRFKSSASLPLPKRNMKRSRPDFVWSTLPSICAFQ